MDPAEWKDEGRNPANIPSLKKQNSSKPHKKVRVKKMPDVQPALEQLFEKEEGGVMPVPPPPTEINESEEIMKQVEQVISRKPSKRLSEMI